jgi:predicted transcriptional regulator
MAMTLRLPEELDKESKQVAEREHLSQSALVAKAVREYVDRRSTRARFLESVDGIKVDYADALRRLGE